MVQYARIDIKTAYMSGDFAVSYATRLFGAEAVAALPLISRGKRKGQIKGILTWQKASVGGWHRNGDASGVVLPGFVSATVSVDGKVVLETTFSTYEKKAAAEAARAAERAHYQAQADAEWLAEIAEIAQTDPERAAKAMARREARLAAAEAGV
jgi:hypothetical protein